MRVTNGNSLPSPTVHAGKILPQITICFFITSALTLENPNLGPLFFGIPSPVNIKKKKKKSKCQWDLGISVHVSKFHKDKKVLAYF